MTRYHIGVDSTDSATLGMCTTYLGANLLERMEELPLTLSSPPELIRLNPNVPWKTRGNGAVCLRYTGPEDLWDEIMFILENTIWNMSVFQDPQTNPGCAVLEGEVPPSVRELYHRALHEIIEVDEVKDIGNEADIAMRGWKNERGLIGALAAVGADLSEHTYEAILYRPGGVKDRHRKVDPGSLRAASVRHPSTFFNIDDKGDPVCIPHSPCPVILGIRGMDPGDTLQALREIKAEGYERWVLWKTNQHTDAHIEAIRDLSSVRPFSSVSVEVTVSSSPEYREGGHLFLDAEDKQGYSVVCAAFEPTKEFRKRLAPLVPKDRLKVWGSIRSGDVPSTTINLEKVDVIELAVISELSNPRCPDCDGPTASMGKGQGLRCKRCGYRGEDLKPLESEIVRDVAPGMIEPPQGAWRHLFKPEGLPDIEEKEYGGPWWGIGAP